MGVALKFNTGDTVELQLDKHDPSSKYRTVIESVEGDKVFEVFAPIHSGKVVLIGNGNIITVVFSQLNKATSRYEIFSFKARLESKENREGVALIKLLRISDFKKTQRRDFYRLNFVKEMELSTSLDGTGKIEVLSRDISAGGMRCVTTKRVKPGEKVIIHIVLVPKEPIDIIADVVSCDNMPDSMLRYDLRLRFNNLSKSQQTKLIRQINGVQAEYLKKLANKDYESHMEHILPNLSEEKLVRYNADVKFSIRLGYLMAINWILCFVIFILIVIARPVNEYPVARFFNIYTRTGWSPQALNVAIGVSVGTIILSILGLTIDRLRFAGRKPVNMTFVVCGSFALLAILICVTLYATVLNV
ncbi:hypothetical protein DWB64_13430 [Fusibacter sp. A1]|nr:hypothetical protein DWB64_13430 [Fusibacter sp. A1]